MNLIDPELPKNWDCEWLDISTKIRRQNEQHYIVRRYYENGYGGVNIYQTEDNKFIVARLGYSRLDIFESNDRFLAGPFSSFGAAYVALRMGNYAP
jgi:hypothetical protein